MPNAWSKVPLPLKVLLGVLFLPFTILYGIYVMWKQGRFSTAARVALTAVGALLAFAMLSPAFGGSGPPPSDQPATPASTNVAPVSSAESTSTATVSTEATAASVQATEPATVAATEPVTPPPPPPPPPVVVPDPPDPEPLEVTVYRTKTGAKYHVDGCRYLKSRIAVSLKKAKAMGLAP
jgi:type IV secretory pathway VirB10-like protein